MVEAKFMNGLKPTSKNAPDRPAVEPDLAFRSSAKDAKLVAVAELPFALDALEPVISRETMHFHYDKHFVGYIGKLNGLIAGTEYEQFSLEDMIRQAAWKRKRAIVNNASQVWNHAFFWQCLSDRKADEPDASLSDGLRRTFGSYSAFKAKFIEKGLARVGSGWLWLAYHPDRGLIITTTENTIPVWLASGRVPLLVCDLWEHAYYLDWRNDRAGWLNAFISHRANWQFASKQLASAHDAQARWQYGF